ncbi:MAG: TIM-barrel domain-containing protein, partial [Luteolibacter sp.]
MKNFRFYSKILALAASAFAVTATQLQADDYPFAGNPPITPRWAYEHWVWEDNTNTQASTVQLVSDYQTRNIPVGAVIVDSPWSTAYMNFAFNSAKYPDAQTMITNFRNQGVQVVCWMVGMINQSGGEAPLLPHPDFNFVRSSGYQVRNPANADPNTNDIFGYWKGAGLAIDFTNPNAVNWFMGNGNANLIAMGVRGFKVDESNAYVSDPVKTSAGSVYAGANITKAQYTAHYQAKVSDWIRSQTSSTGNDGIVISRPYSFQGQPGGFHCPVSKLTAGWCGDFDGDFAGFSTQIGNIYTSADAGYSAVGFEVGGYYGNSATRDSLLRQAQFAALLPVMENGGSNGGLTNHVPWYWDSLNGTTTTVPIYRYYATLHHNLAPFLFHTGVTANLTGTPAVTNTDIATYRHVLGNVLLTRAVMAGDNTSVLMKFPTGLWIDWWNQANMYSGDGQATVVSAIDKAPLYVRAGAIIPAKVDNNITGLGDTDSAGKDTILVYPYGTTSLTYHRALGDGIPYEDVAIAVTEGSNGSLQVNSPTSRTWLFKVKCFSAPSSVTGADTWSYDGTSKTLTIQKAGSAFTVSVTGLVGYSSITPISTTQPTGGTVTMNLDDAGGSTSFNPKTEAESNRRKPGEQ